MGYILAEANVGCIPQYAKAHILLTVLNDYFLWDDPSWDSANAGKPIGRLLWEDLLEDYLLWGNQLWDNFLWDNLPC